MQDITLRVCGVTLSYYRIKCQPNIRIFDYVVPIFNLANVYFLCWASCPELN